MKYHAHPVILMRRSERGTKGPSSGHRVGRHWRRPPCPLIQVRIICLVHNFRTTHYIHIHISKHPARTADLNPLYPSETITDTNKTGRKSLSLENRRCGDQDVCRIFPLKLCQPPNVEIFVYYRITSQWQNHGTHSTVNRYQTNSQSGIKIPYPCNPVGSSQIPPTSRQDEVRPVGMIITFLEREPIRFQLKTVQANVLRAFSLVCWPRKLVLYQIIVTKGLWKPYGMILVEWFGLGLFITLFVRLFWSCFQFPDGLLCAVVNAIIYL